MSSLLHNVVKNAPDLMPTTREKYLRDLNAWIAFAGDSPGNWTRAKAQEFYNALLDKMRPQSATRLMASVRYASKWWAHVENRPELDFALVRTSKPGETLDKRALTENEARDLILACGHHSGAQSPLDLRDLAMIVVWLETGMRRMSLASMTIQNTKIDGVYTSSKLPYENGLVRLKGMGTNLFPVPLSDAAIAAIKPWRAWLNRDLGPLFCGVAQGVTPNGRTGYTASKSPMSFTTMQKMIETRGKQAGIDHIYPHMFRHTFVTWRSQAGLQVQEIASITGHTVKGLGAIGGYMDMKVIGEKARQSTPSWLRELMGV